MNSPTFKILLLFLLLICSSNSFTQTDSSNLKIKLDSLLTSDFFSKTQIAIDVYDLTSEKPVYSKNEKLLVRPASIEKIFTTSAALKFLDSDYSFKTSVYHTGEIEDSVCTGNIFIVGKFDPDFSISNLDSLVREIKNYGINKVSENLYADVSAGDSLFLGNGWMWDDDPGSFFPNLSPMNVNQNSIQIIYEPGEIGKPAVVNLFPENNFTGIKNNSVTIDTGKSTINITREWINRNNTILISGNIPKDKLRDTVSLNIYNPTFYFLDLMKESFNRNGIAFGGKIDTLSLTEDAEEIFTIERNIDSVIVPANKTSNNLDAEMLLRTLALRNISKNIGAKDGIVFVDSLIALVGFDPKDYRIVDGSGLSFYNLISAELTTGLLKYFYTKDEDLFIRLYNSFPISGFDGTLKNRMNNSSAAKRVHAKTGSMSGTNNLAGYLRTKNGNLLAFSIFIQNFVGSHAQARLIQDNICELLHEEL
jgi:serine-type D-Ala-D-Ala carboxypeptidase/endopeptidase (penicillin-binding protein 4)